MPFFDNDQDDRGTVDANQPQMFKIGEEEYNEADLKRLIDLGKIGVEAETKYNTKIDKVWPDYTRNNQKLKELESKINEYETARNAPPMNIDEEMQIRQAREAAKKVGLITNDEIGEFVKKEFPKYYQEQREAERLIEKTGELEKKYTGEDGRPAFRSLEVMEYMRDTGITNAETAYKVMYEKDIDKWRETQINNSRKSGYYTETRNTNVGNKQPVEVRPNKDNLSALLRQALYPNGGGDD